MPKSGSGNKTNGASARSRSSRSTGVLSTSKPSLSYGSMAGREATRPPIGFVEGFDNLSELCAEDKRLYYRALARYMNGEQSRGLHPEIFKGKKDVLKVMTIRLDQGVKRAIFVSLPENINDVKSSRSVWVLYRVSLNHYKAEAAIQTREGNRRIVAEYKKALSRKGNGFSEYVQGELLQVEELTEAEELAKFGLAERVFMREGHVRTYDPDQGACLEIVGDKPDGITVVHGYPGSGKTVVIQALAQNCMQTGKRALVITHNTRLKEEIQTSLENEIRLFEGLSKDAPIKHNVTFWSEDEIVGADAKKLGLEHFEAWVNGVGLDGKRFRSKLKDSKYEGALYYAELQVVHGLVIKALLEGAEDQDLSESEVYEDVRERYLRLSARKESYLEKENRADFFDNYYAPYMKFLGHDEKTNSVEDAQLLSWKRTVELYHKLVGIRGTVFVDEMQDLSPALLILLAKACPHCVFSGEEEQSLFSAWISRIDVIRRSMGEAAADKFQVIQLKRSHRMSENLTRLVQFMDKWMYWVRGSGNVSKLESKEEIEFDIDDQAPKGTVNVLFSDDPAEIKAKQTEDNISMMLVLSDDEADRKATPPRTTVKQYKGLEAEGVSFNLKSNPETQKGFKQLERLLAQWNVGGDAEALFEKIYGIQMGVGMPADLALAKKYEAGLKLLNTIRVAISRARVRLLIVMPTSFQKEYRHLSSLMGVLAVKCHSDDVKLNWDIEKNGRIKLVANFIEKGLLPAAEDELEKLRIAAAENEDDIEEDIQRLESIHAQALKKEAAAECTRRERARATSARSEIKKAKASATKPKTSGEERRESPVVVRKSRPEIKPVKKAETKPAEKPNVTPGKAKKPEVKPVIKTRLMTLPEMFVSRVGQYLEEAECLEDTPEQEAFINKFLKSGFPLVEDETGEGLLRKFVFDYLFEKDKDDWTDAEIRFETSSGKGRPSAGHEKLFAFLQKLRTQLDNNVKGENAVRHLLSGVELEMVDDALTQFKRKPKSLASLPEEQRKIFSTFLKKMLLTVTRFERTNMRHPAHPRYRDAVKRVGGFVNNTADSLSRAAKYAKEKNVFDNVIWQTLLSCNGKNDHLNERMFLLAGAMDQASAVHEKVFYGVVSFLGPKVGVPYEKSAWKHGAVLMASDDFLPSLKTPPDIVMYAGSPLFDKGVRLNFQSTLARLLSHYDIKKCSLDMNSLHVENLFRWPYQKDGYSCPIEKLLDEKLINEMVEAGTPAAKAVVSTAWNTWYHLGFPNAFFISRNPQEGLFIDRFRGNDGKPFPTLATPLLEYNKEKGKKALSTMSRWQRFAQPELQTEWFQELLEKVVKGNKLSRSVLLRIVESKEGRVTIGAEKYLAAGEAPIPYLDYLAAQIEERVSLSAEKIYILIFLKIAQGSSVADFKKWIKKHCLVLDHEGKSPFFSKEISSKIDRESLVENASFQSFVAAREQVFRREAPSTIEGGELALPEGSPLEVLRSQWRIATEKYDSWASMALEMGGVLKAHYNRGGALQECKKWCSFPAQIFACNEFYRKPYSTLGTIFMLAKKQDNIGLLKEIMSSGTETVKDSETRARGELEHTFNQYLQGVKQTVFLEKLKDGNTETVKTEYILGAVADEFRSAVMKAAQVFSSPETKWMLWSVAIDCFRRIFPESVAGALPSLLPEVPLYQLSACEREALGLAFDDMSSIRWWMNNYVSQESFDCTGAQHEAMHYLLPRDREEFFEPIVGVIPLSESYLGGTSLFAKMLDTVMNKGNRADKEAFVKFFEIYMRELESEGRNELIVSFFKGSKGAKRVESGPLILLLPLAAENEGVANQYLELLGKIHPQSLTESSLRLLKSALLAVSPRDKQHRTVAQLLASSIIGLAIMSVLVKKVPELSSVFMPETVQQKLGRQDGPKRIGGSGCLSSRQSIEAKLHALLFEPLKGDFNERLVDILTQAKQNSMLKTTMPITLKISTLKRKSAKSIPPFINPMLFFFPIGSLETPPLVYFLAHNPIAMERFKQEVVRKFSRSAKNLYEALFTVLEKGTDLKEKQSFRVAAQARELIGSSSSTDATTVPNSVINNAVAELICFGGTEAVQVAWPVIELFMIETLELPRASPRAIQALQERMPFAEGMKRGADISLSAEGSASGRPDVRPDELASVDESSSSVVTPLFDGIARTAMNDPADHLFADLGDGLDSEDEDEDLQVIKPNKRK